MVGARLLAGLPWPIGPPLLRDFPLLSQARWRTVMDDGGWLAGNRMQRLVPAIIEAWREAERAFEGAPEPRRAELAARIRALQQAHAMAVCDGADREAVVRFLADHGLAEIVSEPALA